MLPIRSAQSRPNFSYHPTAKIDYFISKKHKTSKNALLGGGLLGKLKHIIHKWRGLKRAISLNFLLLVCGQSNVAHEVRSEFFILFRLMKIFWAKSHSAWKCDLIWWGGMSRLAFIFKIFWIVWLIVARQIFPVGLYSL